MSTDHLRKQRRYLKAKFTIIEKFLEEAITDPSIAIAHLTTRRESATTTYQEYQAITGKLAEIAAEDEFIQRDEPDSVEFDERYFAILDKISTLCTEREGTHGMATPPPNTATVGTDSLVTRLLEQQSLILQQLSTQTTAAPAAESLTQLLSSQRNFFEQLSSNNSPTSTNTGVPRTVKLPTIKLPTFDGNIENWKHFSDSFKTLIDESALSGVQKHQYLISALTGSASKTIESIEISEQNYAVAWKLLVDRYENEKLIHKKHIQCLFEMPPSFKESSQSLQALIDHVYKHLRVLQAMKRPTTEWSDLIVHMIEARIDKTSRKLWEDHIENIEHPTTDQILEFLQRRCQILDRTAIDQVDVTQKVNSRESNRTGNLRTSQYRNQNTNSKVSLATSTDRGRCFYCKENHFIYSCNSFLSLPVAERIQRVKSLGLCINCLKNDHFVRTCKSGGCRVCSRKHNTLCHLEVGENNGGLDQTSNEKPIPKSSAVKGSVIEPSPTIHGANRRTSTHHTSAMHGIGQNSDDRTILMATAVINARPGTAGGTSVPLRILLDSASESNFITVSACKRLNLKLSNVRESVTGLNHTSCNITQLGQIIVSSRISDFTRSLSCLVVPNITKRLPSAAIQPNSLKIPSNLKLADPSFFEPSHIDVLIGAELFFDIVLNGQLSLGTDLPSLQNSEFGWLVAGVIPSKLVTEKVQGCQTTNHAICLFTQIEFSENCLSRFWDIEEYANKCTPAQSLDEIKCEQHFEGTFQRNESGRFVVRLPFKTSPDCLGESTNIATKRFASIERKFKANTKFHEMYRNFMQEYIDLNHMTRMDDFGPPGTVYLPHHGVFQESNGKSKLRVVFDASARTSSGISLNDTLYIGPTLQDNIIDILLRFRLPAIAITGDLKKMYRQILVSESDRDFQRIIWRDDMNGPLQSFRLNTVTYGQSCAPYLAIKCVRKLAEDNQEELPLAAKALLTNLYVDDVLTGMDDEREAVDLLQQLNVLLSRGGFSLHKLRSNVNITDFVNQESIAEHPADFINSLEPNHDLLKTLGLTWDTGDDSLYFFINLPLETKTKRQLLSSISRLFDPLGLISPIVIKSKMIMQETWGAELGWDEPLPDNIKNKWNHYVRDLGNIDCIRVPRRIAPTSRATKLLLHAFCDASTKAYGSCIYIQSIESQGLVSSSLLCSKSRVAPVKSKTITLPRLELCGAVTLVRLVKSVEIALKITLDEIHAWTDSTIVLAWISGDPSKQRPFVSNRAAEIQSTLPSASWHHVKGEDNPADLISRGCSLTELVHDERWWSGPLWLKRFREYLGDDTPTSALSETEKKLIQSELKNDSRTCMLTNKSHGERNVIIQLTNKYSSLSRLQRVVSYVIRFINHCRGKQVDQRDSRLSVNEIESTHAIIVKAIQQDQFAHELAVLRQGKPIESSSILKALSPFIDKEGILRVGGRLEHSNLTYDQKHPILLPAHSHYTKLIFQNEHTRLNHAGPQLLLFNLRQRYWPIHGKNLARQIVHKCVVCTRHNPKLLNQLMGQLPTDRVTHDRPFSVTGVDFAGPVTLLSYRGRGRKTMKGYIALFICLATKAIHLEAVCDLSTDAFIASMRRFVGRRGCPRIMWSDNGTNFVGARNELDNIYKLLVDQHNALDDQFYIPNHICWKFIPPAAPHMGGLWEAGVKSCKFHLKRIMGDQLFTFEEFSTALVQIEACLNSRPLFSLPSTTDDPLPLSPGHFLIGSPLTALPDVDISQIKLNRLDRWQLIQRVTQDFWTRWSKEYLTSLQGKTKWVRSQPNIEINDVVLISDPTAPPLKWKMGRVIKTHPGSDGVVRVVSLKTTSGICKRPLTKICKLPTSDENVT